MTADGSLGGPTFMAAVGGAHRFEHLVLVLLGHQHPRRRDARLTGGHGDHLRRPLRPPAAARRAGRSGPTCRPSSSATRFTVGAAWARIWRPTAVEPVKDTMSTAGSVVSSSAPAAPASTTTLRTPAGRPGRLRRHTEGQRRERGERARPQDHRVPRHQRRDQLLEGHDDRPVVRGDGRDHADRFVTADAQRHPPPDELVDRDGIRLLLGQGQVELDGVAGERHAGGELRHLGEHHGLAGFRHHGRHHGLVERSEVVDDGEEHLGPLLCGAIGPHTVVETSSGLTDGTLDLGRRGRHELGHAPTRPRCSASRSGAAPTGADHR